MTANNALERLRKSPWQRLAIALFAVPAVLVGLLAMHVLTTSGMNAAGTSHASAAHAANTAAAPAPAADMATAASSGIPVPADNCGALCAPSHEMLGMACILALMITIVLLTLHLILIRWDQLRMIVTVLAAKAAALAPPAPPSLHVLSISRT